MSATNSLFEGLRDLRWTLRLPLGVTTNKAALTGSPRMAAPCQKQTFRLLLDIIVGGQGCSSSWSITRETSPPEFLASGRRRCRAAGSFAHRAGADLSVATGASDRATRPCRRIRHHGAPDRTMAVGAARPAICYRQQAG